ncbi:hypothetical protein V6C03_13940 [Methyloligella sp. 2.7D]|uniref:hypothetical protein n=1 Tax=unclassified Methyloligella TaxID=2625955 RepID=UPI00157C4F25|nr:hypothetical protein [Methyloligella sp. GL2]QKP77139.1 hypothetical protein HT051_06525 [Methyloligella sp. GL2]
MAKAKFHKAQRVFVNPVGTWALIEKVIPKWIRGCDEPIKVTYDCGLGREFSDNELAPETAGPQVRGSAELGNWRIVRAQNRWKSAEQCSHHPFPGTHPMVVTGDAEWGGWRVPGAEYDLDPYRIEKQAELIVRTPALLQLLTLFVKQAEQQPENLSADMADLAATARALLEDIGDQHMRTETRAAS